ncbi:hypothetical protein K0E65_14305 [Bacteroides fragilis]|uniref:DUF6562 domain-containing protein n=1 Tax=Bacteroides fragilis TaxID=817 RepID=UPI001F22D689|nr:DUF6562 domain-containing protein [Bacteroides fragilis]MCE8617846.1 hypothetical protein [Bacteroides fragilis]UHZ86187.1 hypothetical protein K0E65_14305 [Bacteroides fragilis]
MKPINKWICLLTATLALAACGDDEAILPAPPQTDGQTVKVQMNIDPASADALRTRAGGSSEVPQGYRLRCIVAAYDRAAVEAAGGGGVQPVDTAVSYLPAGSFLPEASFSGELCLMAGNAYSIVAWADYVKAGPPAADLYYDTADLTGITQLVPDGNSEGVDAEDAYTAAVSYTASASAGMWSGEPDKLVMALTRPLTRVQLRNLALNGVPDLTQGTCRIACTSTAAGANAVLESGIAGGEQPMRFSALTGKVSGTETLSPSQQAQVQANGSVSPSFDPYVYIFFDTPADPGRDLTITVRYTAAGGGETSYGVKKAAAGVGMSAGNVAGVLAATEEEEEGTPLEIFRVGLNRSVLIKANSVDDGSLTLYAIPAALPAGF